MPTATPNCPPPAGFDPASLAARIKQWGRALGFQAIGIAGIELGTAEARLQDWLRQGRQGEMAFMSDHGSKRTRPAELVPGTVTVITARMNYLPQDSRDAREVLAAPEVGYISRYALGRDYHKTLRNRLQKLADGVQREIGPFGYRVFCDSAPVMEVELATHGGLGWRGKHGLLLSPRHGSWFFLGELFTDLPLPTDAPLAGHCGSCRRCIDACPTGAIAAPYQVDARRCVSYLTIELKGSIPLELRPSIGNRIYGCDDCQLACPWNRFAHPSTEPDFNVRHGLDQAELAALCSWNEEDFRLKMAGSPILRIGYTRWLRNLAVALGNAPPSSTARAALAAHADHPDALVREHVAWALARHRQSCDD